MIHNFLFSMKLISYFFLIIGLLRLLFKASLDYFPFHEAAGFLLFHKESLSEGNDNTSNGWRHSFVNNRSFQIILFLSYVNTKQIEISK
jgi:hypothetical protein